MFSGSFLPLVNLRRRPAYDKRPREDESFLFPPSYFFPPFLESA